MAKKKWFTNHKAFWKAAENAKWMADLARDADEKIEKNPNIKFDTRNLMDLAPLLFDVSQLPKDQKEAYFLEEYNKMAKAFNTASANDPTRPDPNAIKPYMRKMFEKLVVDLDAVDWNNVKQIENALTSMKATQTLATLVDDFASVALDLFPTHDIMARLDAYAAKSYMAFLEGRVAMSYAGLDDICEYVPIGQGVQKSTRMQVQAQISNVIYNATLARSEVATIDPTSSDLLTKHFLGKSFSLTNAVMLPDNEFQYTEENYLGDFLDAITACYANTSLEQMLVVPMNESDPVDGKKFSPKELLLIDGKPMSEIIEEIEKEKGLAGDAADVEAGKILRDALLQAKPVTLMTATYTKAGKVAFHHKDIRVDLDKLNEADRLQNHNIFRRVLHNVGLWRIPEKYPNNGTRDIRVDSRKNSDDFKAKIAAAEDRFVKVYNSIQRPSNRNKGVVNTIPKLTKEEVDLSANRDSINKNRNIDREPIPNLRLDMEKKLAEKPVKLNDEPVVKEKPLTK